jgi:hypothetical protein
MLTGVSRSAAAAVRRSAGVLAAAFLCLQGCAASTSPAEQTAERFERAVAEGEWAAGCALLAPRTLSELEKSAGKSCPVALEEEDLGDAGPVRDSHGYGTMAQVRLGQDTYFLAEFDDGWKVMAAGCAPDPGKPYDCALQGG